MLSKIKKSMIVNGKFLLAPLLGGLAAVFIASGCGTWNKGTTGPGAVNTPTTTPTLATTATLTNTATATATSTPTGTPAVAACPNPAAVDLGTAANYAILAETGITDVPSSAVTGDIANSGTATQIGITCAEVNGTIFEIDGTGPLCFTQATAAINIAVNDKSNAYTTANGQADCVVELGAGTLSGLTLTRGTYVWAGNVTIPTDLHLDALGDPNARWIFQIGGTLTMASAMSIILDNGALAQNITWTVADFTQIGTTAHMEGTIIGFSYIALQTGASINGRLLSHTQVTLDQNAVTLP